MIRVLASLWFVFNAVNAASTNTNSNNGTSSGLSSLLGQSVDHCAPYNTNCILAAQPLSTDKCNLLQQQCNTSLNSDDPCLKGTTSSDYQSARQQFDAACQQANVPSNTADGDVACGFKMAGCRCQGNAGTSFGQIQCAASSGGGSSSKTYSDTPSASQAASQYATCPAMASRDLSSYKKDLDKAEDDARSDRDKVNDAQDKAEKAQESAQTKQDSIADKITEAQNKYDDDREKAQEKASEAQKQVMDAMNQMQNQLLQVDEQIGQQNLAISQAGLDRDKAKMQVNLNCHAQAVATASKLQNEALQLNLAGKLNLGGQKDLLKKVGMSDRQHWEAIAKKYYTWCLQDQATMEQKSMAEKTFSQQKLTLNKAISDLKKRKDLLNQQLKQIKDPNGTCAAPVAAAMNAMASSTTCSATASQYCQSLCQAAVQQQNLGASFARTNASLQNQLNSAALNGQKAEASAGQQAAQAQAQLDEDNTRAQNLRNFLGVTRDAGGDTGDDKAYANVTAKYSDFTSKAAALVVCTNNTGNCNASAPCLEAKRFLDGIGQTKAYDNAPGAAAHNLTSTSDPGTRTPSSSGGTGAGSAQ